MLKRVKIKQNYGVKQKWRNELFYTKKPCKSNVGFEKVFLVLGGGERGLKPFLKFKTTVLSKSQSNKNTQLRSAIIQIRPKNGQSQSLSS